ncbi:MAG TPA: DegT/DnrJ/EryC1/StrS aminotransferase family protein [Thermoanaerobaculia bacterium]|nr:DegT/DnrJ/EryC1/StrS aminotransferase family protein [Thermoanaerobaculia bacterium]
MAKTSSSPQLRETFLPFAVPDIGDDEIREVTETLRSGWVTTGPKTKRFEAEFAAAVSAKHAIAVNSCTAALHLCLEAAGVRRGDEVITTPYTFAASAEVIRYFDARPVLVDVDPESLNIRADLIEAAVTAKTKAIIPVHIAGAASDLDPILDVAHRRGLAVIEDAAHSFPTRYKGRMIGTIGNATCFSFYATKTITTGEGGMITTNDDGFAERCRVMSLHGISHDAWKRYTAEGSWRYEIVAPGFKYNLTDIASALGLAQLRKAEAMYRRRQEIAARYNEAFTGIPELQTPTCPSYSTHAWHLYPLRLHLDRLSIDRASFVQLLRERRIGVSVHFIPLHLHPYYRDLYGYAPDDFPVAYREYQREISLPIYSMMSDDDVESVIGAVMEIAAAHRR